MSKFIEHLGVGKDVNILVFCSRIETRDYLKKVLNFLEIETTVLEAGQKDMLDKCDCFNGSTSSKKALIATWGLGSVGINLHGADTVICYEPITQINKIEQGFGRIDRIGLGFSDLSMIYFQPECNLNIYDNYRINTIYQRLFTEHLPNIPSKNIMFDTEYLDNYVNTAREKFKIFNELTEFLSNLKQSLCSISENEYNDSDVVIDDTTLGNFCDEKDYDINLLLYEFDLRNGQINLQKCKTKLYEWLEITKGIDTFIASTQEAGGVDAKPSELLKTAIYYYDNDNLKVTSIKHLLDRSADFNPSSYNVFATSIQYVEENIQDINRTTIDNIDINERYTPVFAECIKNKLRCFVAK